MAFRLSAKDRKYLRALLYLIGIILFWRGIWDITYEYPIIDIPYVSLFVGLAILTFTGYIFHEVEFLSGTRAKIDKLNSILEEAKGKTGYAVQFYDELTDEHEYINPKNIRKIENDVIVLKKGKHEHFFPLARVSFVKKSGKIVWKS